MSEPLQAQLRHRERQIEAMRQVSSSLLLHSSPEAMIRETLAVAVEVLCADAGSLLLHDEESKTLVFRYVIGPAAERLTGHSIPEDQGIAGRVFQTGEPDMERNVSVRPEFHAGVDEMSGFQTRSLMTVPLKRRDGASLGVMQVVNARENFDEGDLEVLEALCSQASLAIEHANLVQEARKAEIINLIGDISHDIKNMLTPIQSGVWTLGPLLDDAFRQLRSLQDSCPEEQSWGEGIDRAIHIVQPEYSWILKNASDAADKVQTRTKQIADAIKGETTPPQFQPGDFNEVTYQVARALYGVAEKEGVSLHLDLELEMPEAEFDRRQVYNALYNLVNNAIPETPRGGSVTLRSRAPHGRDNDDDRALLQVQDTGKGIPDEVRSRLFTDQAVSTKPGGTGLGTRIVAGVVRRHHGEIKVDSEAGCGSTFSILLPLKQEEHGT